MTKMCKYLRSRGLLVKTVAQKVGSTSQAVCKIGENDTTPNLKTLEKLANAMTDLGAPTTVVDLTAALYGTESKEE